MRESIDRRDFLRLLGLLPLAGCAPAVFLNEKNFGTSASPSPFSSFSPSPSPSPLASASPTASPIVTPSPKTLPSLKGLNLGCTYSYPQSRWLFDGSMRDAKSVLQVALDELGIKHFRLEAYWNWLQDTGSDVLKTDYNIEWQLEKCRRAGVKTVVMCVGRKVPHWPEYHIPEWAKKLSQTDLKQKLLEYLALLVDAYADDPRITHWQIENEPFFEFGQGSPFPDQKAFLAEEVKIVRDHDKLKRPTIITESGDTGNWIRGASLGDILGVSYYGISYENGSYRTHDTENKTPLDWAIWALETGKPTWMIELQAEPWGPRDNKSLLYEESLKSMDPQRLIEHLIFVKKAGFKDVYLWGLEWWLWMKDNGHPEMWNLAKEIYSQQ